MANNFFDNKIRALDLLQPELQANQAEDMRKALIDRFGSDKVKRFKNTVTVYEESVGRSDKLIDMKPYFRNSRKAKRSSTGGWYMVVPIRRYTNRKLSNKTKGMSKRLYNALNRAENNSTVVSDYLYTNRKMSAIPELNYEPRSKTINKMKNPRGRGSIYVAFRTVSDRSPANSWIINRDKEDPDNMSDEARRIVREVQRARRR